MNISHRPGVSTIVLAGRRIDAPNAGEARFPYSRVIDVTIEIHTMLRQRRMAALVCSAACGADLIALTAARSLGMRRRIVLPFSPSKFRATSVVDRPGGWGDIFDEMIAEAQEAGDLVIATEKQGQKRGAADPFTMANERLIEEAMALSGEPSNGRIRKSRLIAAVIWEGHSRGTADYTEEFAAMAKGRGLTIEEIRSIKEQ